MADTENFPSHLPQPTSHLPQPTRHGMPSPQKQLTEMSASATNSRTTMPPPTANGHKRQGSNLPESATKRPTLSDRAGQPLKSAPAAPKSNAPVSAAVSSTLHTRYPSSISSRSNSIFSRSTSSASSTSSSFSASVGSRLQPPTSMNYGRPKAALAKDRGRAIDSRPATSMGTRGGGIQDGPNNKRMAPSAPMNKLSSAPRRNDIATAHKMNSRIAQTVARTSGVLKEAQCISSTASISAQMSALTLSPPRERRHASPSKSPPLPPHPVTPSSFTPAPFPSYNSSSPRKNKARQFLTKSSNLETWDPEEQYGNMERMYQDVCKHYKDAMEESNEAKQASSTYKDTIASLEEDRKLTTEAMIELRCELQTTKYRLEAAERSAQDIKREFEQEIDDLKRDHRIEMENVRQSQRKDIDQAKADHRDELRELRNRYEDELESERSQRLQAVSQVSGQVALDKQRHQLDLELKDQQIRSINMEIERLLADVEREKTLNADLRQTLSAAGTNASHMEAARQALQAKIDYLESDNKSQSEAYADMERKMNQAIERATECEEKLRKEEMLRRKLHNQVQELKGNIRVFCRVRPSGSDASEEMAQISFPETDDDPKDIEVRGQEEANSLGKDTTKIHPFSFDRVFDPSCSNAEIFEEISQLIQSALDGYNVCIFAYGQTGAGKTYTMSSDDGMIPQALRQIYSTSKELATRGWTYQMEGSFVEVYNEELRDLLGKDGESEKSGKKHEIRHDMVNLDTTITDVNTLSLDSQEQVEGILAQAMSRRSVAATKANERSSRSHSVFILRLKGQNSITGKKCKGTLNLVDLAGSERLSHSKAEGARLKETQAINKSLSCLGDVIGALGQQQSGFNPRDSVNGSSAGSGGHIPYRNSKLTHLLQLSLGGNSKTLMFVMVAPEKKCLSETITSLKFADKVSRTRIGVARKTTTGR
ncbi:hypothetical protein PV10_03396 [Exophiala mesophila]|uniref:Kinesin-like protein n=1 Tax=Exophiala mesophila TaxID=212818 RepID=A0A0D1Y516_EXOME|nr:uncharacterized protein PV10_03396 [Exophiala mesophila]KIV95781.1 hypothetical protein PV10_03396 [Exophiala mesophila]